MWRPRLERNTHENISLSLFLSFCVFLQVLWSNPGADGGYSLFPSKPWRHSTQHSGFHFKALSFVMTDLHCFLLHLLAGFCRRFLRSLFSIRFHGWFPFRLQSAETRRRAAREKSKEGTDEFHRKQMPFSSTRIPTAAMIQLLQRPSRPTHHAHSTLSSSSSSSSSSSLLLDIW